MRDYISAKFLLASPPPTTTVVPAHFEITRLPARVALGARKPRSLNVGGAKPTSTIAAQADRRALTNYAARGF